MNTGVVESRNVEVNERAIVVPLLSTAIVYLFDGKARVYRTA